MVNVEEEECQVRVEVAVLGLKAWPSS